jgi:hypothetical protein
MESWVKPVVVDIYQQIACLSTFVEFRGGKQMGLPCWSTTYQVNSNGGL